MVRHKKDFTAKGKKHANASRTYAQHTHPEPPEGLGANKKPSFKAAAWDLNHCDAKRCSGKRLMRLGLMRELHVVVNASIENAGRKGIVRVDFRL